MAGHGSPCLRTDWLDTRPLQRQIIETVVREREQFSYCVEYLDQLHPDRKLQLENNRKEKKRKQEELLQEKESEEYSEETFDRYSY